MAIEASTTVLTLRLLPRQSARPHELQGGERKTYTFFLGFGVDGVSDIPLDWCRAPLVASGSREGYALAGAWAPLATGTFGDRQSWRREHVVMGKEAGFASAVSTIPGVVEARGYTNLHALPRIAWDGRQRSLRMMRVMLSGIMFPQVRPTRDNWV